MSEQKSTSSRHSENFQPNWTTFWPKFSQIIKLGFEIHKTNVGIKISIFEISCVPIFRQNGQLWIYGSKFAQKWILGSKFQKSKSRFGINILEILCAAIFRSNGQLSIFEPKFAQKWPLGSKFQKSKPGLGISTSSIWFVPIFSQNGELLIAWPKLGKLPNYVQYFGSNIAEGVTESWLETEMSWVELGRAGWRGMKLGRPGRRWVGVDGGGCTI